MDKVLILNRIKEHYSFSSDADFARHLGVTPQNLKHWYTRNTFDISILATKCNAIDPYWIITGEGEMLLSDRGELDQSTENITISREVFDVLKQQLDEMKAWRKQNERLIDMLQKNIEKGGGVNENYPVAIQAAAGG